MQAAYWANVAWQQANYTWYDWSYMMGDTQAGGGGGGHGRSISAGEFIGMARNSTHGGSWSDGYGYLFESDEEAYEAFDRYSEYHGSWGNTIYKTRGAYRAAFLMNLALNAPINLAITLACTNCDQIDVLGQTWWFDDEQGRIIGMHWLNGSGRSLFLNDKSWTAYMEANSVIGGTIAGILRDDASTRVESGSHAQRIAIELAQNDRSSGYGMLHGTLNFDYAFEARMINTTQIEYSCTFMWNDRIDPSARQGDTPWVIAANLYYSPADYDITIKWTHTYIINK